MDENFNKNDETLLNEETVDNTPTETVNFESENTENVAPEERVDEVRDESVENTDDIFESEQTYYPPLINVTPADKPDPENKKGLRVLALVMALVILFTCGSAAGYYFGSRQKFTPKTVDLTKKPENEDMYTEAEVYEALNPSVVGIISYNSGNASSASGVVYTEDGYIITNDHIYDGIASAKFKVYTYDGKEYDAEYVAGDTRSDLAVIKIKDSVKLTPAVFGDSEELYVGEPVVAMGRPTGAKTDNNITSGVVSLLNSRASVTSNYSSKYIQTNAAINPGSSGGALINMYGQVVGITSSKIAGTAYEGIGYAIPTVTVKRIADSLISNGYVADRARLGITYTEVDSVTAEINNMTKGLYIASVDSDSDLAGKVSVGDTITAVNGTPYYDSGTILDVIENSSPGDTVTFTVSGEDGTRDVTAKLLPDVGSSSYSNTESSASDKTESTPNTSEFSFPFGD